MLSGVLYASGLRVDTFHAPSDKHACQDRFLVRPTQDGMRAAAIDGVSPWNPAPAPGGDAAQWAASVLLGFLSSPLPLMKAFLRANSYLNQPGVTPSQRQPMASGAAVDAVLLDGRIQFDAVVSADAEVWVLDSPDVSPSLLIGGDFMRPEVRAMWLRERDMHPDWTFDEKMTFESVTLEDPAAHLSHAVGRFPNPHFLESFGATHTLMIASDGARLAEAFANGYSAENLYLWLMEVSLKERHDDITCLILQTVDSLNS